MRLLLDPFGPEESFRQEVEREAHINLRSCLQCSKCGGSCAKGAEFDLTPRQLVESILDGFEGRVLNCRAIWYCEKCHECSINCPAGINVARLMAVLRQLALKQGIEPDYRPIDREFRREFDCPKARAQKARQAAVEGSRPGLAGASG
ncbi:MAG: 4Fe-4S dicluster domain-containing protein [Clostridia bacterium]|nr:4Fe-4S dicluster domain-containing protein [Clostridia bacterium]